MINDQVQGGAPSYRHNLRLLELFGFKPTPVHMRIAFGVGDKQWTNHRWGGEASGEGCDGRRRGGAGIQEVMAVVDGLRCRDVLACN